MSIVLLVLVAISVFRIGAALLSGRSVGKALGIRDAAPADYWGRLAFDIALLLSVLWLAYNLNSKRDGMGITPLLLTGAIYGCFRIMRALQTGKARFGQKSFDRVQEPSRYWSAILLPALAAIALLSLIFHLRSLPSHRAPEMYAVADVVRDRVGQTGGRHLVNVRRDAASRRICGEFRNSAGGGGRFYGASDEGQISVAIERERSEKFERDFRLLCSGRWITTP